MNRASYYGNEISYSESSDESSDEDELLLRAELREQEQRALADLSIAISSPVAFCIRTNVDFDGLLNGLDAPIPTKVISFSAKEFIQVKRRFDQNWWIGRVVREGSPVGFIPSPSKLDTIRHSMQTNLSQLLLSEALNVAASTGAANNTNPGDGSSSSSITTSNPSRFTNSFQHSLQTSGPLLSLRHLKEQLGRQLFPMELLSIIQSHYNISFNYCSKHVFFGNGKTKGVETKTAPVLGVTLPDMDADKSAAQTVPNLTSTLPQTQKKKPFFKKSYSGPPYELVPNVRPVVVVGPAQKGFEVTDMMQKAFFDSLKRHFEGRLVVTRVNSDISGWKRLNVLINMDKKALTDRTRGRQIITALEVQREIERIFDLATTMQLVVLDSETINHPHQIAKSSLAPIIVYIKISSLHVLQRLIKNRGKAQKKQISSQVATAEKLMQCAEESFDVVLEQNNLEGATEALANYLESYLRAIYITGDVEKGCVPEQQLPPPPPPLQLAPAGHVSSRTNEAKALPPMIPGRPGLNIALAAAGNAGFQLQDLTCLAGDRHANHTGALGGEGETGEQTDKEAGETGDGDEEGKKTKEEGDGEAGEEEKGDGDSPDGKGPVSATTDEEGKKTSEETTKSKKSGVKSVGKSEALASGILKLGANKKKSHPPGASAAGTHILPDRAHAIALAEAVVKNANAAAAAAAATRLDMPSGPAIGLHQSHQSAHNEPGGTPKIYASRSSRQAKQRQEEIENAKRKFEEALRREAEARAASGAQRHEKRRQRRLMLLAEKSASGGGGNTGADAGAGSNRPTSGGAEVKFGEGPVLGRSGRMRVLTDNESQSVPGGSLKRNSSNAGQRVNNVQPPQPIPLIIHPPESQ